MHPILDQKENNQHLPVACFGELLMRFSPDAGGEWIRNNALPVFIGGAELNVASALALWGIPVEYLTVLPDNAVGRQLADSVSARGIGNQNILFAEGRVGLYYLPVGAELKNEGVIYDRSNSAFALLQPGNINWNTLLKNVGWLHVTAISPALNENIAEVCKEVMSTAQSLGVITSLDLNYRAKLWKYGKAPGDIIPAIAEHADIIMGNVWAAETMLGIPVQLKEEDKKDVASCVEQANKTAETIFKDHPHCKLIANTYRFTKAEKVDYYAVLNTRHETYTSKKFSATSTIDKAGSGDCFMAGLMYSLINDFELQETVNFAAAAAFGKLQVRGDNTTQTVAEVRSLLT